ncbi:hypothetical protein [Erythrobacter sp. BLCC-B19]|uniref:hypothetical protein n=1 Tax=Erythrobacter sp. BLCC-B19 TaxID=3025315 RepID=UPI0023613A82|nr:hypothetical protein [Erythrobacter sp. BLCC-B19]WDA40338.1 hypothetical protein PS060_12300 [Erythrobacter sp. BLCC-B19]
MNRINQASFDPQPYDNTRKLPVGSAPVGDAGEVGFVAAWLGHVEAGRIGGGSCGPTVSRPEADPRAPTPEQPEARAFNAEARAIVLANERLMFGRQRTILG